MVHSVQRRYKNLCIQLVKKLLALTKPVFSIHHLETTAIGQYPGESAFIVLLCDVFLYCYIVIPQITVRITGRFLNPMLCSFLASSTEAISIDITFLNSIFLIILTLRVLMSYIYGAPILDVSRSHTTTQHSR